MAAVGSLPGLVEGVRNLFGSSSWLQPFSGCQGAGHAQERAAHRRRRLPPPTADHFKASMEEPCSLEDLLASPGIVVPPACRSGLPLNTLVAKEPRGSRAAIAENPLELKYASVELRADRGLVLEAVAANGEALCYADKVLQNDRQFVLLAVTKNIRALQYSDFRKDHTFVQAAMNNNLNVLAFAADEVSSDIILSYLKTESIDEVYNKLCRTSGHSYWTGEAPNKILLQEKFKDKEFWNRVVATCENGEEIWARARNRLGTSQDKSPDQHDLCECFILIAHLPSARSIRCLAEPKMTVWDAKLWAFEELKGKLHVNWPHDIRLVRDNSLLEDNVPVRNEVACQVQYVTIVIVPYLDEDAMKHVRARMQERQYPFNLATASDKDEADILENEEDGLAEF